MLSSIIFSYGFDNSFNVFMVVFSLFYIVFYVSYTIIGAISIKAVCYDQNVILNLSHYSFASMVIILFDYVIIFLIWLRKLGYADGRTETASMLYAYVMFLFLTTIVGIIAISYTFQVCYTEVPIICIYTILVVMVKFITIILIVLVLKYKT